MEKIEKIMDREIAWRIFAHEFNTSSLYISEGDERAPNYIITPTGVKCNRLFIIGVITEVENIGKDNNLWRARIADPTGVFTLYAGQYQPEAAIFLSELEVPAYVALVGKARKYEPEDGNVYLSVRPEEINAADEKQRDMWVIETAERTLERIKIMEDALDSGLSGTQLQEFLEKKVKNAALINGVVHAIRHYKNLDRILPELKNSLVHAVRTVTSDSGIIHDHPPEKLTLKPVDQEQPMQPLKPQQPMKIKEHVEPMKTMDKPGIQERPYIDSTKSMADEQKQVETDIAEELEESIGAKELKEIEDIIDVKEPNAVEEIEEVTDASELQTPVQTKEEPPKPEPKEIVAGIIDRLDIGKGTSFSGVIETAQKAGIGSEIVESAIKELMDEGRCYEPKIGILRKV
jgi:RPA family protein